MLHIKSIEGKCTDWIIGSPKCMCFLCICAISSLISQQVFEVILNNVGVDIVVLLIKIHFFIDLLSLETCHNFFILFQVI